MLREIDSFVTSIWFRCAIFIVILTTPVSFVAALLAGISMLFSSHIEDIEEINSGIVPVNKRRWKSIQNTQKILEHSNGTIVTALITSGCFFGIIIYAIRSMFP